MAQIAHHVFFTLKDKGVDSIAKLVAACNEYLDDHPGVVYFAVGTRNPELVRPVNDADFDVSLHVVFADRKAHDDYQVGERHLKFIEQEKEGWAQVRVFDSDLA